MTLSGYPSRTVDSTTGAGFTSFMPPSTSRNSAGRALMMRPAHTGLPMTISLQFNQSLESAPEHALAVERQRLEVHHGGHARVLENLGVDAVAVRARPVDDVCEHHRLAGFELDA